MTTATTTLADSTAFDRDLMTRTMHEAIRILRSRGRYCRLLACPHAWDSIKVESGDCEYDVTPWLFEAEGCNFAIGRWEPEQDDYTGYANRRVAFEDGRGLADVIEDWMKHGSFDA